MRHLLFAFGLALVLVSCRGGGAVGEGDFEVENVDLEVPPGATGYVPVVEGPLHVLSATPSGTMVGMAYEQGVAVTFSKPMVPLGDAPEPPAGAIRLEPRVEGTLRWEGTQTLVFQPAERLPVATRFSAALAGGIPSLEGERLAKGLRWTFETPRPLLIGSEPRSGERYVDPAQAMRLEFNQAIRISDAAKFIVLRALSGTKQRHPVSVQAAGDRVLSVRPATPLPKGTALELLVLPGLRSATGELGLKDTARVAFTTYPALALTGVTQPRAWWEEERAKEGLEPGRGITFTFSTPVRFGDFRQAVSFSPATAFPPGIEAQDDRVSESHVLRLEWQPETSYTVTVRGLRDQFGQVLREARETFRTRAYDPSLRVPDGILVVEADERPMVPMRVTNVESVQFGMQRLTADQIVPLLHVYDPNHYYGEGRERDKGTPVPASRTGRLNLARNKPAVVPIGLSRYLRQGLGVVALHVTGPKLDARQGAADVRAIAQVTRMGITGKFSAHRNLIFVTELRTAKPVPNAAVSIRGSDNRVYWRGRTDAQGRAVTPGWAVLKMPRPDVWSTPQQYAFAEAGGDLAFTSSLYQDGLEAYRFDMPYDWSPEPRTEAGSVFTDRGLYRAGETAYLKGILRHRTDADWQPVTDSVRVLVAGPRGQLAVDRRLKPSALGTFDLEWAAPASADQGVYTVRVAHASDTAAIRRNVYEEGDIAQGSFRVDAFRTATFVVNARTPAPSYVAGDFFEGSIEGRYLFGADMRGQPVRYVLQREPTYYTPPGYDAYRFGTFSHYDGSAPGLYRTLLEQSTTLGPEGRVEARVQLPGNTTGSPAMLVWSGTVEDPARQESYGRKELVLHPGLFYLGLKPRTTFLDLSEERTMAVDVITVDPGGRPVAARDVAVELVRQQWNSVREVGADGRLRWRSERTEEPMGRHRLRTTAGKAARVRMEVVEGGSYVVRATGHDVRGNVIRSEAYFYATGRGYVAWERADDDRIDLVPEKTSYAPGETARIMVQSPYEEATALVTVEREGVISSRVETLRGSAPQVEIPLGEEHLPNVFVSVVLLHGRSARPGVGEDTGAPGFKIGYANLQVDPGVRHLHVEVEPDKQEYRPGDEVTVSLRLRDAGGRGVAGEIAFSAADAGVLNLIGYALPDPFETFYGPRPLGVTTSETRANLVEQRSYGQKEEHMIGGGGDASFLLRRDFRPLAHWAPAVRTNGRGQATVTFRLPENLTTFRLMATALTADNRFGAGRQDIVVTQPLVLQPALPRFARLDDRFEAGVLVSNQTGQAGEAVVTARGAGMQLAGAAERRIRLSAGETKEVRFGWAAPQSGTAQLTFEARLGAERDALQVPVNVSVPMTRLVTGTFSSTEGTAREALRIAADRVPGMGHVDVRIAGTALTGLDGATRYLFTYPYGCLEQRTSAVRPLLVADELLDAFDLRVLGGERRQVVERYLADLNDFWTGNGFSMWPGEHAPYPYVSAYAVLALAEAKAAGFAVPEGITREAVALLARQVRNRSERPSYYSESVWDDTRAFMLYALARHDTFLEGEIAALAASNALSVEGESVLLRTVLAANRPALARLRGPLLERLRSRIRVEATEAYLAAPEGDEYDWIFASDTRATAYGLAALVEADPSEDTRQTAQRMVRRLMQWREEGHWETTQDNAAVLDALRAFFLAYERTAPDFTAEVRLAGQSILQEQFSGRSFKVAEVRRPLDGLARESVIPLEVRKEGAGQVYYSVIAEAYSKAPLPAAQNGLNVERRVQRLDGQGRPSGEAVAAGGGRLVLRAGEMVRVTLRVTSPTDRNYVVVDDALPAGLEVLNAAFETTNREALENAEAGDFAWWGSFNHTEMRDDRVLLFADYLRRGEHTYTYVARATTPGTFVHPPAGAEMMYRPEVNGRTGTGQLVVQAPDDGLARR